MRSFLISCFAALVMLSCAIQSRAQQYPGPPNVGLASQRPAICTAINPVQPNQPQWYFATDTMVMSICTSANTWQNVVSASGTGVTSFTGDGVLLSNSASTGAVTATLGTAGSETVFGNCTGSPATPSYQAALSCSPPSNTASSFYLAQNCGASSNCQTVSDDVKYVTDASTIASNATVTCPNSDCNFTSADVGKIVFAMAGSLKVCGQTTIASINSANSIQVTATCSNTSTGNALLLWGHDDTTNVQTGINSWYTAGGGTLFLPTGMMFLQKCVGHGGLPPSFGLNVVAPGFNPFGAATFVPTPLFDTTTAFFTGGLTTCFFGGTAWDTEVQTLGPSFQNITIWGAGQVSANGVSNPSMSLFHFNQAYVNDVILFSWLENATSLVGFDVQNASTLILSSAQLGCPSAQFSNEDFMYGGYYQANGSVCSSESVSVASNGVLSSYGVTIIGSTVVSGGIWNSYGDDLGFSAVNGASSVCAGNCHITGALAATAAGSTQGTIRITGGTTTIQNSSISNSAATNAYGVVQTGGNFIDRGGNVITGTTSAYHSSGGNVLQQASSTGALNSSGAIALSVNWGTGASVGTFTGMNSPTQFTVTNGTVSTGASPTITYTFPTPYLVAPLWCNASDVAGTNTLGTFATSSLTATSVVFTYSLTPTINDTEVVQVTCYVQE